MHGGHANGHKQAAAHARTRLIDVDSLLGHRLDAAFADLLHTLEHQGGLETVPVATADLARRRLRVHGDQGTEFRIALPRTATLVDGAVLHLAPGHAAVLRVEGEQWLRLHAPSAAIALELGYAAGNLHWRVRFESGDLLVALEGPPALYLDRIAPLVARGVTATPESGTT